MWFMLESCANQVLNKLCQSTIFDTNFYKVVVIFLPLRSKDDPERESGGWSKAGKFSLPGVLVPLRRPMASGSG